MFRQKNLAELPKLYTQTTLITVSGQHRAQGRRGRGRGAEKQAETSQNTARQERIGQQGLCRYRQHTWWLREVFILSNLLWNPHFAFDLGKALCVTVNIRQTHYDTTWYWFKYLTGSVLWLLVTISALLYASTDHWLYLTTCCLHTDTHLAILTMWVCIEVPEGLNAPSIQ